MNQECMYIEHTEAHIVDQSYTCNLHQTHGTPLRAIAQGQLQMQQLILCSEVQYPITIMLVIDT